MELRSGTPSIPWLEEVSTQPIRNGLADQPDRIGRDPAIGSVWLIQLELVLHRVAQPIEELTLKSVTRCCHSSVWIAAKLMGDRRPVRPYNDVPKNPSVLKLASQYVQQSTPELWIG